MSNDGTQTNDQLKNAKKQAKYLFDLIDEKLYKICENESLGFVGALCQVLSTKLLMDCILLINRSENTQEIKDQHIERVLKECVADARNLFEKYKSEIKK